MKGIQKLPNNPALVFSKEPEYLKSIQNIFYSLEFPYIVAQEEMDLIQKLTTSQYSLLIIITSQIDAGIQELKSRIQKRINFSVFLLVYTSEILSDRLEDFSIDFFLHLPTGSTLDSVIITSLEFCYLRDMQDFYRQAIAINGDSDPFSGKYLIQKKTIYNLAISLSQGSGLGTSITLVDMIKDSSSLVGDHYLVESELMDLLIANNQYSRSIIEGLNRIVNILDAPLHLEPVSVNQILDEIPDWLIGIEKNLSSKNSNLFYHLEKIPGKVLLDTEKMSIAVEELVINASKYCMRDTSIEISSRLENQSLYLRIANRVHPEFYGGIPEEVEKLVLQPFIRLYPPSDINVKLDKIVLGLGLTVVDYIVSHHSGIFKIKDEIQKVNEEISNFVVAEISLPIIE